ncbi:Eco57I restriction-modification methylase domain-containing protein [Bacillus thuringiensis]|uniref:Eco57I restriction-modification methylase domain-containing protein n=1 Tax=Bacillus thuringiensis TaxID=1428 RepID=UPI000BF51FA4|nr:N-6 DNA methylase [Bacillus thuringiensis]PFC29695.1 SAM-dependent methyltransferase [Bacillus thuringiensis]
MNQKCQIFTPENIVNKMLDSIGYKEGVFGKRVLENSCGDGNILKVIVKRYIENALKEGISLQRIKKGLETDIYAVEIDSKHYKKCLDNLNEISKEFKIYNVCWNIVNGDSLKIKWKTKFDFIIGNPPYIKYSDIEVETRAFLKERYTSCSYGKYDYCYAFIEDSIKNLSNSGKMAYLIPNSIFKNVFGNELRRILLPNLIEIYDYTVQKIFSQAITSSAIIVVDKEIQTNIIKYHDIYQKRLYNIEKKSLEGKWIFSFSSKKMLKNKCRFSDYFNASIAIATLLNKAYVIKEYEMNKDYLLVGNWKVEKTLIRKAASPKSLMYKKDELIIFPYFYKDDGIVRYTPETFERNFPEATKYLNIFRGKLQKRKAGKNIFWFEYGRTQALQHLNQPKLLLSTVVTKKVNVYELSTECIPYSGIYITKKGELELDIAKKILNSQAFYDYVKSIGINANGTSIRITANDINNFEFEKEEFLIYGKDEI